MAKTAPNLKDAVAASQRRQAFLTQLANVKELPARLAQGADQLVAIKALLREKIADEQTIADLGEVYEMAAAEVAALPQ